MLTENKKIVPVGRYIDISSAAANDADSINMAEYNHATFIIQFHALGGAATYVKVYSGATDGAKTSACTFYYAFGSAAAASEDCDVLADWSTSSNLSVAHATYDNYILVIEVPVSAMDSANEEEWLTLSLEDTDTGATGNATIIAILDPRYQSNQSVTALE